jgi:hypothetical protein
MRVCDRCGPVPATEQIRFKSTDERKDLCQSCSEEVREFVSCKPAELKQAEPRIRHDETILCDSVFCHIEEGG